MTRKTNTVSGRQYHYYYCPTTKKHGCADTRMLKESGLTECVLESLKAHIANIASVDSILAGSDGQKAATALAAQYVTQIDENERQLEKLAGFKSSLYESMISGIISKDDYKTLKGQYTADETRLRDAICGLRQQHADVLVGKGERLRWMKHFTRFEGLTELDRRTVVNMIRSIRVVSKTELEITFNYQDEYETACSIIGIPAEPQDFVGRGGATERSECPAQDGRNEAKSATTMEVA